MVVAVGFGFFLVGLAAGEGKLDFYFNRQTQQNQQLPEDLDYNTVERLYDLLRQSYDGELDEQALLDGLKTGLVSATGDPYSEYLNSEDAKEFNEQLSGSFTGIGAELGTDEDKNIIIVSPLSGYPAEKSGLKSQDIITAVDGDSISGMTISKVVREIRGPAGTKVTLTIIRGTEEPFDVTIVRQKITIASVESKIEGNIGYLKINQFSSDTAALAKTAARNFKTSGVKAVVLDVRGNPGGFLNSAVDIASLWLDRGQPVVQEKRGEKVLKVERASGGNDLKGLPTVVLIDNGSASASEIVAGALKDHKAATLVGVKSFGKGSIQRVEDLPGGGELKVTIARWFTPSGKNIDKEGIVPDVEVERADSDSESGSDTQKDRAYRLLRSRLD